MSNLEASKKIEGTESRDAIEQVKRGQSVFSQFLVSDLFCSFLNGSELRLVCNAFRQHAVQWEIILKRRRYRSILLFLKTSLDISRNNDGIFGTLCILCCVL